MVRNGDIPDRWLDYKPIGKRIEGTRFIAFKVPLRKNVNGLVEEAKLRLDCDMLLEKIPNLGIIIDLTNTYRYYSPESFINVGVEHQKLMIPGKETPSEKLANEFNYYVMNFLNLNQDNDKLIGVHCTHGVNRTGYLICNYMISEMQMDPEEAIQKFRSARGHEIERENYVQALHNLNAEELEKHSGSEEKKHGEKQWQRAQHHNNTSRSQKWQHQNEGDKFRRPRGIYKRKYEDNHSVNKKAKYGYTGEETSNAFRSNYNDGSRHKYRRVGTSAGYGYNGGETSNAFKSNYNDGSRHTYRSGGTNAGYGYNGGETSNAFKSNGDDRNKSFRRNANANSSWRSTDTNARNNFRGGETSFKIRPSYDDSFNKTSNSNSNYNTNYRNDNLRTSRKWNRSQHAVESESFNHSPANASHGREKPYNPAQSKVYSRKQFHRSDRNDSSSYW